MLSPGEIFHGRFEIVRCIKAGGMGAVYEVIHLETRRHRALKTMLPELVSNQAYRERFRREATVAANVDSDHIVDVFDAGVDERTGIPFIVMELLKGEELGEAVLRRGKFQPAEVIEVLDQVARALDRAHSVGIIHRDVKPENVFLARREDGSERVKLLDFGIAKIRGESTSRGHTTIGIGSPLYMAPEQIRGQSRLGPQADTYALANIAFTLLCGKNYWEAAQPEAASVYSLLLAKTSSDALEPASSRAAKLGVSLSQEFDLCFFKATAQLPIHRFDSATELVSEFAAVLGVEYARRSRQPSLQASLAEPSRQLDADVAPVNVQAPRSDTERALTHDLRPKASRRRASTIVLSFVGVGLVIAAGQLGRWSYQRFQSVRGPELTVSPSKSTLGDTRASAAPPPIELGAAPAAPASSLQAFPAPPNPAPLRSRIQERPRLAMPKPLAGAPAPSAATDRGPNCSRPFYVDDGGIKRTLPECLE